MADRGRGIHMLAVHDDTLQPSHSYGEQHRLVVRKFSFQLQQNCLLYCINLIDKTLFFSFNEILCKTRSKVESVIGMWKNKFPVLLNRNHMQPDRVVKVCYSLLVPMLSCI